MCCGCRIGSIGEDIAITPLVLHQRAALFPFFGTVVVWAVGERILTFRDFRARAWNLMQDRGSYLVVLVGIVAGFVGAVALGIIK